MRIFKIWVALAAASLVGCGGGGGSSPTAASNQASTTATPPTVTAAPTVTLTAAPSSVVSGKTAALTWSSTGAASCSATGGWTASTATSGTATSPALTASATFVMVCTATGGTTATASATVAVTNPPPPVAAPTATLVANPVIVAAGAASTLTWTSTNATACTASGSWLGTLAANGSKSSGPVATNSSYSLTCTGPGGTSGTATAQVNVVPTAVLTANPSVVTSGAASTLTWSSTNATACTASGGWAGALAPNGNQTTGAVTATTAYSLTCAGLGGTSTVATATVTVSSNTVSLAPRNAAIALTQTKQFTATVPGGGAATWAVDGVAGGSAAVGTISNTGLYTAGTTAGLHTVVATSVANATQTGSASIAVTDLAGVYTYHSDSARDGSNTHEYALTKTNVNTATFGKVAACPVDGAIYAQPLWASNVTIGGVKHNVVFVATEHDGLFAFDADASPCSQLWAVNLIDAAHGGLTGETTVPSNTQLYLVGNSSGDIQPEIGVTGTPVIDSAAGILYVVSKSVVQGHPNAFYQRIHAIDITTGLEKTGSPTVITGTVAGTGDGTHTVTFNTQQQLQRAGLALVNGVVYVAFTAHEDAPPWYGWMMSYQYTGTALTQQHVFNVSPNLQKGGIWMSGGAPAVDAGNSIYAITGNGQFNVNTTTQDYGDSLLKLTPTLGVMSYFTPADQALDAMDDIDFSSGGAAILADLPAGTAVTHALICGGKDQIIYVLNRDTLGGFQANNAGAVQTIKNGARIFATGAFWNNSYFLGGYGGPLNDYQLNTMTAQLSLASASSHVYGSFGATPSVSSNGPQNGVVWTMDSRSYCTKQTKAGCGPTVLYAHDANNVATELYNSSTVPADAAGYAVKFTLPTIANGRVYLGTRGNSDPDNVLPPPATPVAGELSIYGLKP
jgi:hypothetical protein